MDLATNQEWSAEMAADQLSGEFLWRYYLPGLSKPTRPRPTKAEISALVRRIKEAMYSGQLPWRIQQRAGNSGQLIEIHLLRPLDVIEWALQQNIQIPDEYRDWLKQVADPDRAEPVIPKEESLPVVTGAAPNRKLLNTPEIGRAFNGINGWDAKQWAKNIGKAAWAKPAKTDGGGKPKPDLWDPVELVKCLLTKNGDAESESLVKTFDKAFQAKRPLADWKSEWAGYAEHWGINPPI